MLVMAHINLYLSNPPQVSASYPFASIDVIGVNAEADAMQTLGVART